jgi:hypothetical protein
MNDSLEYWNKAMPRKSKETKAQAEYTGILAEPMYVKPNLLPDVQERERVRAFESFAHKFVALFEHFGIDRTHSGSETELIIALAKKHVPGFQVVDDLPPAAGRPPKWAGWDGIKLYKLFLKYKQAGYSIEDAAEQIRQHEPGYQSETQTGLYRRYFEISKKNEMLQLFREGAEELGVDLDEFFLKPSSS